MAEFSEAFQSMDRRLENWGRWARQGFSAGQGRCGSAEGRYVSRAADADYADRVVSMVIDADDAERVESVVVLLDQTPQLFLKHVYVFNRLIPSLQRDFNCSRDQLVAYRVRCAYLVMDGLGSLPPRGAAATGGAAGHDGLALASSSTDLRGRARRTRRGRTRVGVAP